MSSQLRDLSVVRDERGTHCTHEGDVAAHPRGMGFRVLSRIARVHADEETSYVPRHRLDVPDDSETHASHAS